jgi:arginyl-tRNA synthetase
MKVIDKKSIAEVLKNYISDLSIKEIESSVEIPPPEFDTTYSFPCFKLSKFLKKSPNLIAQELSEKIEVPEFIKKIKAIGPYINFIVKSRYILESIFKLKSNYGRPRETSEDTDKLRIVIEYPSPNTNKPLHFGHVRNMLLGKTLSNLLEYKNHKVFQVNLYNNRGIHISKSMLAYKNWGNKKEPDKKTDHFVGDYYVLYNEMAKKDDNLDKKAQDLLRLWESGDQDTRDLWNKMNKWAIDGFKITLKKFGISFDKVYFEDELYLEGRKKIFEGLENGLFEKTDDGAIIARLKEKYNLEDKILVRSDGTSIYITQDIYLAYKKKEDFNYDRSIYVVGDPQIQHFKWLFAILDMLGFKEDNYHLSYGMIDLPSGRMKSREGTAADADDIIEEVEQLAFKEVNKRYQDLTEIEKMKRAEFIGLAAIKFYLLKHNPMKWFVFKPDESISFEGETGPYIQYCYARIASIISKSGEKISLNVNWDLLNHKKELLLINQLTYFPEIIDTVEISYNLHLIPQYLLNLCQAFNSFYASCQVITGNKDLEEARLLLIKCVQIIIKIGLDLLGIETLERM